MLILIKNILNVIGKGNKRNYQINNYDLGRRKLCNKLSAISRRKKKINTTDFMLRVSLAYRDVCVCVFI